jgi:nucleotide-binding universal stress UspA family protein
MATTNNGADIQAILIGFDGSDCAAAAIHDLARAGLPKVGRAIVLSVANTAALSLAAPTPAMASLGDFNWATPANWQEIVEEAKQDAARTADEGATLVRAALPGWDVETRHGINSPYRALIDEAEKSRPDLIVVGSHGRSALGRFVLGSTSQFVLGHADCSVRVGRDSTSEAGSPLRLVVGVDGSAGSAAAVDETCRRRWPAGTEVRLVMAVDLHLPAALLRGGSGGRGRQPMNPSEILEAAAELHERSGISARPILEQGDPKHVIVEEARKWGADAVFVGATGHGRLERFLLGSVSAAVTARAHCSVEVVRAHKITAAGAG